MHDAEPRPKGAPAAAAPSEGPETARDQAKREALRRVLLEQRIEAERERWEARHDPFSSRNLFGRLGAMSVTIVVALTLPVLETENGARLVVWLGISAALLLGPIILAASRTFARTLGEIVRADSDRGLRGRRFSSFNAAVSIATVIMAYAALYAFIGFHDSAIACGAAGRCISHDPAAALFLSLTTMTTTGYGDLTVFGWGRLVSAAEQVTGVFMFAAFVSALMKFSERPTPPPPMGRVRVLEHALQAGKDDAWIDRHLARLGSLRPDAVQRYLEILEDEVEQEPEKPADLIRT